MKRWIWNWTVGGWNSCMAATREEAIKIGNQKSRSSRLVVDERTLRIGAPPAYD